MQVWEDNDPITHETKDCVFIGCPEKSYVELTGRPGNRRALTCGGIFVPERYRPLITDLAIEAVNHTSIFRRIKLAIKYIFTW